MDELARRRSPGWVRCMSDAQLHATAMKLARDSETRDLSAAQEWLWQSLISELEYRWRTTRPASFRCSCMLCVPPFPDPED